MDLGACPCLQKHYLGARVGLWRSLVARPSGGRKVAGSSPASPTKINRPIAQQQSGRFVFCSLGIIG